MEYINDLGELFETAAKLYDSKYEQIERSVAVVNNNIAVVNGIELKEQHVRKAFKINTLKNLDRFETSEICKRYHVNCDIDGIWLRLFISDTWDYFAMCTYDGKYLRARINKVKRKLVIGEAKQYGTTNREYINKRLHYSDYLFKRPQEIGISEHVLVAIAFGLFDKYAVNDLAILTVNHKNRNHYDNRPCNLEPLTDYENGVHRDVTNEIIKYDVFKSMSYDDCVRYKELNSEQHKEYIKLLKEQIKINDSENINHDILEYIHSKQTTSL